MTRFDHKNGNKLSKLILFGLLMNFLNPIPYPMRVFFALLSVLFFSNQSYAQSPTAPAKDFNVFIRNDVVFGSNETDGGVAIGGTLSLNGVSYQANNMDKSTFDIRGAKVGLLVGRGVNFNTGNVLKISNGIVKIGETTNAKIWYQDPNNATPPTRITKSSAGFDDTPRIELTVAQPVSNPVSEAGLIDFEAAFQTMKTKSLSMSACVGNVALSNNPSGGGAVPSSGSFGQQLYYDLKSSQVNIINLKGSDFNNVNVFAPVNGGLKPSASTILVINVDAPGDYTWNVPNFSALGIAEAPYIIINFYNTNNLTIGGSASVIGTIFAPSTNINKTTNTANIEGQIIANSLIQGAGENHSANFAGTVPDCAKPCTVSVTASGDDACLGETIVLIATGSSDVANYAWAGANGFASTIQTPNRNNATAAMGGVYTVSVTSTSGASCSNSATAFVAVNIINPSISPSVSVFEGDMIELSAGGGQTFSWSGPSNFTSQLQEPMRFANAAVAGVYTVVVTGITGCTASATTSVEVKKPCNITLAISATTVCIGGTIQFGATGTNIAAYQWTGPAGFSSSLQNPNRPNATMAMAGNYSLIVTGTAGSSCTASATLAVGVNPIIASASSNSPVAAGQSLNLSLSGGFTYTWAGPNAFASTSRNPSIANVTTPASGVYSATIVGDPGCTAFVSTTVSITPPLCNVSVVPSATTVCVGGTIEFSATGSGIAAYQWAGPAGFSSSLQNPNRPNAAMAMAGNYSVTVTSTTGNTCTASATLSVNVNPIIASASSNSPVIAGQSLNLSLSGGFTYTWAGPNAFASTSRNPSIANVTTQASGVYSATIVGDPGCTAFVSTTVSITPPCNIVVVPTANNVCIGGTLAFSANAQNATTYEWDGPGLFSSNSQNPSRQNAIFAMSGVYSVTVSSTAGASCTASNTVSVSINPIIASASSNSPVVAGQSLNLSLSGGFTYTWAGPNAFASTSRNPSIANVTIPASGVYSATIVGDPGCTAFVSTTVNITPACLVSVAPTAIPVCVGTSIQLSAGGQNAVSHSWRGPSNFISSLSNPIRLNASTDFAGIYTVVATGSAGSSCTASGTVSVSVNTPPTVSITTNSPVTNGQTLNLSATGGGTYTWTGPAGYTSTLQNPSRSNANAAMSGIYTVSVSTNGCGASATTSVSVSGACNVAINPTANNVCAGQSIQLSANGLNVAAYSWAGPSGFSATIQNPSRINAQTAMSGIYSVTATGTTGIACTASATVSVNIGTITATIKSNSPVNIGQSLNLSATGGNSYQWAGPVSFGSTAQNPSRALATSAMSGVYSVTVNGVSGCTATLTTSVLVQASCSLNLSVASSGACIGASILLSANAQNVASYSWRGPGGFTSTLQNPIRNNALVNFAGNYSVTVVGTIGSTCTASAITEPVVINALPTAKALANSPVAIGENINLTATGGGTYRWAGPLGFASTLDKPIINAATQSRSGIYTVEVSYSTGCTASTTVDVAVSEANQGCVKPNAGQDKRLCRPQSSIVLGAASGSTEWVLSANNPTTASINPGTGEVKGMSKNGTYRFILRNKINTQCADTVLVKIGVLDVIDHEVCSPATNYTLPAATGNVTWKVLTGNASTATITQAGQISGLSEIGTYRFLIDNGTCKDTAKIVKSNCGLPIDLAISKEVNKSIVEIGEDVVFTIKVWNSGPSIATGIEIKDALPSSFQYGSAVASTGQFDNTSQRWKIAKLMPGDTARLKLTVKVLVEGISYNTAEVCKANEEDIDSTPCNEAPKEDDIAKTCVSVPYKICDSEKIQAKLDASLSNIQWYRNGIKLEGQTAAVLDITQNGDYTYTATQADCPVSSCCPIRIIQIDCCKPDNCIPFIITPKK